MDQNFQTSFIPKKPIVKERSASRPSLGFLLVLSILIFFTTIAAYGFVYVYKGNLAKTLISKETSLNLARDRFEPERISELKTLDRRIRAADEIMSMHIVASPVFKDLGKITMKNVRYTNFNFGATDDSGLKIAVKLKGEAIGYRAVAMQSDLFSKNKNFIDPIFSNLSLDSKGHVTFDVDFKVDPSFVNYKQNVVLSPTDELFQQPSTSTNLPIDTTDAGAPINNDTTMNH